MGTLEKMKNILKSDSNSFESSAAVVDGNLILSLPDAINPVVWRMELGTIKSSALEIRKTEAGTSLLLLKTPKGDVHDIAPFEQKEIAVKALMRVSQALKDSECDAYQKNPSEKIFFKSYNVKSASPFLKPDRESAKWILALGGVILVIFLFAYLNKSSPNLDTDSIPGQETATTIDGTSSSESGVPQSANDALKGF